MHIRSEGLGKPMVFALTSGERHDTIGFDDLLALGKVKRQGRGRPKSRFRYFLGDKGYSSKTIREKLRRRGTTPIIPRKSNEKKRERFNRGLYRERNRIERLINRLKQNRRIATRYEKYAVNYLAMLTIASILLWL
ncbi:IS5 family transposase [Moorena bouillonii PNG]|uniref:IS5 family transposase n=1 Tax=Moorena bouillonii PNG TaxID=568701 RepID=A0A1U7N285_9CYAN|nr:IS5 family transposase [Moorena bouillonii PNG]